MDIVRFYVRAYIQSSASFDLPKPVADLLVNVSLQPSGIRRNIAQSSGMRVGPARVVELRLPGPEHPARHTRLLIELLLSGEPLLEEVGIVPVNVGGHAPLAGDVKVLAADDAGVTAGAVHELVLVAALAIGKAEADVVVIVEADEAVAGNGAVVSGVARVPLGGHVLDVQLLVIGDLELGLNIADGLEGTGVVALDQAGVLARGRVAAVVMARDGLVEDLDHADGAVGVVGVNATGHPGHPLLGAAKVIVVVEAGGVVVLASKDILLLAARGTVKVDNDIDSKVGSLSNDLVEVRKHAVAVSKWLAVLVDNVDVGPVADGDTDGVQANVVDGLDSVGVDPVSPVVLKAVVALLSVATGVVVLHTVKLGGRVAAAHDIAPLITLQPRLADQPA